MGACQAAAYEIPGQLDFIGVGSVSGNVCGLVAMAVAGQTRRFFHYGSDKVNR